MYSLPQSVITAIDTGDFACIKTSTLIECINLCGLSDEGRTRWRSIMAELDRRFADSKRRCLVDQLEALEHNLAWYRDRPWLDDSRHMVRVLRRQIDATRSALLGV